MKRICLKRPFRILALALIMTLLFLPAAMAAGSGTVELFLKYQDVTFDIYRVGDYEAGGSSRNAALTPEFEKSKVALSQIWADASGSRQVAEKLAKYAHAKRPAAYRSGLGVIPYTDPSGVYSGKSALEDLEDGIYLFVKSGGDKRLEVEPFIVPMPYLDEAEQTWNYYVKAYPKCEHKPGGGGGRDNPPGNPPSTPPSNPPSNPPFGPPDTPLVIIQEGPPPLAGLTILPEPTPLATIPKLGDAGAAGYLIAALAAAVAGGGALLRGRKYRKDEEDRRGSNP